MLCSNCGVENIPNAKFCQNCGVELKSNSTEITSEIELATLSSRIVAYLIDFGATFIICVVAGVVWSMALYIFPGPDATIDDILANIVGVIIGFGYFTLLEGPLGNGQTLGKRLLKLRVVKEEDHTIIRYRGSFVRNILRLIDGIFFYLVGILSISNSDLNQRLGDTAAHTIVIKENNGK